MTQRSLSQRKIGCVSFLISFLLLSPIPSQHEAYSRQSQTSISFAFWSNPSQLPVVQRQLQAFHKKYPEITVKPIHVTGSYWTKLLMMIAGGKAPDVFYINASCIPDYVSKGALVRLTPFLYQSHQLKERDFYPQALSAFRYDGSKVGQGNLYALPKHWGPANLVFFNKDLFKKAGVPFPKANWNWQDFVKTAQRLTRRDTHGRVIQYGASMSYPLYVIFEAIYRQGGEVFSPDLKTCLLNQRASMRAVQDIIELTTRYHVAPPPNQFHEENADTLFEMGKAAMVFNGSWCLPAYDKQIKNFQWDAVPAPRRNRKALLVEGPVGYAISAQSRKATVAWKLVEFMASVEGCRFQVEGDWGVPALKKMAQEYRRLPEVRNHPWLKSFLMNQIDVVRTVPVSPYIPYDRLCRILREELDRVYLGKQTDPQALKKATSQINKILHSANKMR